MSYLTENTASSLQINSICWRGEKSPFISEIIRSPLVLYVDNMQMYYVAWRSWNRASWYNYENNQQDALYRLIYYSKSALHVSGDVSAHHQEHLTVFTVSGSVHPSCCRLVSGMGCNCHTGLLTVPGSNPGGSKIFRKLPDRPWVPSILLYND
jgi:hypothetical protein